MSTHVGIHIEQANTQTQTHTSPFVMRKCANVREFLDGWIGEDGSFFVGIYQPTVVHKREMGRYIKRKIHTRSHQLACHMFWFSVSAAFSLTKNNLLNLFLAVNFWYAIERTITACYARMCSVIWTSLACTRTPLLFVACRCYCGIGFGIAEQQQ